ncbi:MAG TPA: thioesterase family protein [Phycisphaerales bacterium]
MPSADLPATIADPPNTTIEIPIAWGEMDALGHVNNVVYFRYFESARIDFLRKAGCSQLRAADGVGFILQAMEARFRVPLVFPDTIVVGTKLVALEEDRFTLAHSIRSKAHGQAQGVAAVGRGTIVTYDYAAAKKVAIPASVRDAIIRGSAFA